VLNIHRDQDDIVLMYELYAQAARDPRYFQLVTEWSASTQRSIRRVFDPATSLKLESLLEGFIFLRALTEHPIDIETMRAALSEIIAASSAG
jgi:DNA-binding transcriptional regulator YbjK